jgi:hypothetical protein
LGSKVHYQWCVVSAGSAAGRSREPQGDRRIPI